MPRNRGVSGLAKALNNASNASSNIAETTSTANNWLQSTARNLGSASEETARATEETIRGTVQAGREQTIPLDPQELLNRASGNAGAALQTGRGGARRAGNRATSKVNKAASKGNEQVLRTLGSGGTQTLRGDNVNRRRQGSTRTQTTESTQQTRGSTRSGAGRKRKGGKIKQGGKRRRLNSPERDDMDSMDELEPEEFTGQTGGSGMQSANNMRAFEPMMPGTKLYQEPFGNNIQLTAVKHELMLFYAYGNEESASVPIGEGETESYDYNSEKKVDEESAAPWHRWLPNMAMMKGKIVPQSIVSKRVPVFSSKQDRYWHLNQISPDPADTISMLPDEQWAYLTRYGDVKNTATKALAAMAPDTEFDEMRVGNFRCTLLPFQNKTNLAQANGIPAQAPAPKLHLAYKYKSKYAYDTQNDNLVGGFGCQVRLKSMSVGEFNTRQVVYPLFSEEAATVKYAGEGVTTIPIDVEWKKSFTIDNAEDKYEEWRSGDWTPWFQTKSTTLVRTKVIQTQMMAVSATLAETLGQAETPGQEKQCSIFEGDAPETDWKGVWLNNVLFLPSRLEYDIQYRSRHEREWS